MNKNLKSLSILTLSLFVISLSLYYFDTHRGKSSLEGTPVLPGFDVNGISKIEIQAKDKEKITLLAYNQQFVLEALNNYPAETKKINDLFYQLSAMEIKEVLKSSEKDFATYKVADNDFQLRLNFYNQEGKNHLTVWLGDSYKTVGNYLRIAGKGNIFLTNSLLYVPRSLDEYINKSLFESINKDKVVGIEYDGAINFQRNEADNKWMAAGGGSLAKVKSESISSWVNDLWLVQFASVAPVQSFGLLASNIVKNVKIKLKNDLIFWVKVSRIDKEILVTMLAEVEGQKQQIAIDPSKDDDAKMKQVEAMIDAQTTAQSFNNYHQAWAYKIRPEDLAKFDLPKE